MSSNGESGASASMSAAVDNLTTTFSVAVLDDASDPTLIPIIAGSVGGALLLCALIAGVALLLSRRRRSRDGTATPQIDPAIGSGNESDIKRSSTRMHEYGVMPATQPSAVYGSAPVSEPLSSYDVAPPLMDSKAFLQNGYEAVSSKLD